MSWLFSAKHYSLNYKISKLQSSNYRNVSTDCLRTGRGSLGNRGAHFGNQWLMGLVSGFLLQGPYSFQPISCGISGKKKCNWCMLMLKHSIFRQFSQILNMQLAPRSAKIGPVVAAVQRHSISPHSLLQNRHPVENTCLLLINCLTKQKNLFIHKGLRRLV